MWTDDLQSQIFSRIIYDSEMQKLQKKYPDFTLTTSMVSSTEPTFPTLVLQQLETPEVGQDLDNTTINGVNATFQIDVIDNQKNRTRVETPLIVASAIFCYLLKNLHKNKSRLALSR